MSSFIEIASPFQARNDSEKLFFLAVFAVAEDLNGEFIGLEVTLFSYFIDNPLDVPVGKLFHLTAGETDQMAVGLLGDLWLIMAVFFSKVYLTHQPALHQEV